MRVLLLTLVLTGMASAQFRDLTAPGTGESLYFSSQRVLQGSSAPEQGRIYQARGGAVRLVLDREYAPPPMIPTASFSNYYDLSRPEFSRDGKIMAVMGTRVCMYSDACVLAKTLNTTITGLAGGDREIASAVRLSGNGRYLFTYNDGTSGAGQPTLVDLVSGETTALPIDLVVAREYPAAGRVVADDGTVVTASGQLYIVRGGSRIDTGPGRGARQAVIDAEARTVVYVATDATGKHSVLRLFRVPSEEDQVLIDGEEDCSAPVLSADGTRVLFLSTGSGRTQIWTIRTDGSGLMQLTWEASSVQSATLSDDGRIAWYLTGDGRVVQLNLETSVSIERIGRTLQPVIAAALVPGSAQTITGIGFSQEPAKAQSFPLPHRLRGVGVTIGGSVAPMIAITPTAITFQVPWEVPVRGYPDPEIRMEGEPSSSPFLMTATMSRIVESSRGSFEQLPAGDVLAIHGDWQGIVSPASPARPAEIVHLYGTGFGPVTAAPQTGEPAPLNAAVTTVESLQCRSASLQPVKVLFSGLAPGLAGYYQLDIQLPESLRVGSFAMRCNFAGRSIDFGGSFPVQP